MWRRILCFNRVQKPIALPRPVDQASHFGSKATRILSAKTVVPDCILMVPSSSTRELSHSSKSPYKRLNSHKVVTGSGSPSDSTSFAYQASPCASLPDIPGFEFVSAVFEDKKPGHNMLGGALRQNRMGTGAVARHLNSLNIRVPIIGLAWADGTVRAHIDWCSATEDTVNMTLSSVTR